MNKSRESTRKKVQVRAKPNEKQTHDSLGTLPVDENMSVPEPTKRASRSSSKIQKFEDIKEEIVKKIKKGNQEQLIVKNREKTTVVDSDNTTTITETETSTTIMKPRKKKGADIMNQIIQSIGAVLTEPKVLVKRPPLDRSFYMKDIAQLSKELLGKYFVREYDGKRIQCKIVETEAYGGLKDKACHAYGGKVTEKNKWMYREGGHLYVYSIYGYNYCLNVTSNGTDDPSAVLIRGVEVMEGLEHVKENRKLPKLSKAGKELTNGPGKTGQALNINKTNNAHDLTKDSEFYISEGDDEPFEVVTTTRVNIDYSQEDRLRPWRFYIKGNPFVSMK